MVFQLYYWKTAIFMRTTKLVSFFSSEFPLWSQNYSRNVIHIEFSILTSFKIVILSPAKHKTVKYFERNSYNEILFVRNRSGSLPRKTCLYIKKIAIMRNVLIKEFTKYL